MEMNRNQLTDAEKNETVEIERIFTVETPLKDIVFEWIRGKYKTERPRE